MKRQKQKTYRYFIVVSEPCTLRTCVVWLINNMCFRDILLVVAEASGSIGRVSPYYLIELDEYRLPRDIAIMLMGAGGPQLAIVSVTDLRGGVHRSTTHPHAAAVS